MFKRYSPILCIMLIALAGSKYAADINREWVDVTPPSAIRWVKNPSGYESAILFGEPSKPGPYVVRIKWLAGNFSRPHAAN